MKIEFQKFVSNKQFLPDSYTAFKNKIGLTANGEYLTEAGEVVLVWPYKDCVLEGDQTKEDEKRKEIFWNTTLASDEIDRLLSPKVLTNIKRYDNYGIHKVDKLSASDNLIIEGNNLLAIHSLKRVYAERVKLIYIDPPYNTNGDGFMYNDSFNESTWLTFMRNRLEVARDLLKKDGAIFINIGDEEVHYLKVLADEIFGRENFISTIARVAKTASNRGTYFAPSIDFILCYAKNKTLLPEFQDTVDESLYNKVEKQGARKGEKYRDDIALYQSSLDITRGSYNQRYWIECPDGSKVIPPGKTYPPKRGKAGDGVWRWGPDTYQTKRNLLVFKETKTSPLLNEKHKQESFLIGCRAKIRTGVGNLDTTLLAFGNEHLL